MEKVLEKYASPDVNQCSPIVDDYQRVVNYDENGNEFITYEKFDSAKHQRSLGSAKDWSLNALLKAGVNPNFGIRTGLASRIDGVDALNEVSESVESFFAKEFAESESFLDNGI